MDMLELQVKLSVMEDKLDRILRDTQDMELRIRNIEKAVAKMSVVVGFVSAGISAIIAGFIRMVK